MIDKEEIFYVDIYDEWHNLAGIKEFNNFKNALKSGLKILEQDKTEQLIGFGIFGENDKTICTKYHGRDIMYYNKKYNSNRKISRFELMDI